MQFFIFYPFTFCTELKVSLCIEGTWLTFSTTKCCPWLAIILMLIYFSTLYIYILFYFYQISPMRTKCIFNMECSVSKVHWKYNFMFLSWLWGIFIHIWLNLSSKWIVTWKFILCGVQLNIFRSLGCGKFHLRESW